MPYALNSFKKFFSFPEEGGYFNCAAQGPLSRPASEAVMAGMRDKENPAKMDQNYGLDHVKRCRQAVSKLIDWPEDNIALANSTSWGMNTVAQGLDLKAGDEVVFFGGQFPATAAPWELLGRNGVKCVKIPNPKLIGDIDSFSKHLSSKTKVASLEWVHFVSGDRIPLKEMIDLCHKKGILVVVDVTQGLGAIPFSMKEMGVDAVMCSAYKWLYSPYGTGFFALSDKLLERLKPFYLNWLSVDTTWTDNLCDLDIKLVPTAQRFDVSSQMGYLNLDGMTASIEMLNSFNISENFKNVSHLVKQLREELNPKLFQPMNNGDESRQSLIATFLCSDIDGAKLVGDLQKNGFTTCLRNGGIRIAPSIYNNSIQVSQLTHIANAR
jgi:cysteine desulfurase / selenocysteine lyase